MSLELVLIVELVFFQWNGGGVISSRGRYIYSMFLEWEMGCGVGVGSRVGRFQRDRLGRQGQLGFDFEVLGVKRVLGIEDVVVKDEEEFGVFRGIGLAE